MGGCGQRNRLKGDSYRRRSKPGRFDVRFKVLLKRPFLVCSPKKLEFLGKRGHCDIRISLNAEVDLPRANIPALSPNRIKSGAHAQNIVLLRSFYATVHATMSDRASIDVLLNLVPDFPERVLQCLQSNPSLASQKDRNGYSLLHAASSYAQSNLLRALVESFGADVNIVDDDGETPLFYAETVEVARMLVEEFGADESRRNEAGQTALEKMEEEEDAGEEGGQILVAAYLRGRASGSSQHISGGTTQRGGASASNPETEGVHPPPPLPPNTTINIGSASEDALGLGEDVDPEFRRRIEELASRPDFQDEGGQSELRRLVEDAVRGVGRDANAGAGSKRGRTG